ncbi:MAG: phosphoribosylanthranilate isomerase [Bacteroidetes bacterium]|nr:phosphoribosylanthranilate isomerase [Bacteroidota bacterium]
MRIKICGITRMEDALAAVEAGADAVGFIFTPQSRRYIRSADAGAIIASLPSEILPVGVFVNPTRDHVHETIRRTGIRAAQFHGEESPDDIRGYNLFVIKAHRVTPDFTPSVLHSYKADAHLLDAYVEGIQGGTGNVFDWHVAEEARAYGTIVLSGGLTPENIERAIRTALPDAVDVSSGVESQPGVKDAGRMKRFVERAQAAFDLMPSRKSPAR